MHHTNIYQQLLEFKDLKYIVSNQQDLEEIISGLMTKFEPINSVNPDTRKQETVGFECLLAHKDGLNFPKIKDKFLSAGITGMDVFKTLDVVSMLVHFDSIRQFSNNAERSLLSNIFFTINITRDVIKGGQSLNRVLMDMVNCLPASEVYMELHEKIGFKDRTAASEHFMLSKSSYFLDDIFAEAPPEHYLEYLPDKRVKGLKYDHERFWDEYEQVVKGHESNFPKHLEIMFSSKNKMVIIEGVKDVHHLNFMLMKKDIVMGRSIYIQGEYAGADKNFLGVLEDYPNPFGYILRRSPKASAKNAAESLEIPEIFKKSVIADCLYMDLKNLLDRGTVIQVRLPEIFIPLYTSPLVEKKKEKRPKDVKMKVKLENKEQKPVEIEELVAVHDTLLIEGQAGSGKSTLLKHMAYTIMNNSFGRGLDGYLPVPVFLKDLEKVIEKPESAPANAETAEKFLRDYLKPNGLDTGILKRYCKAGKAVFLIDGLDEVRPATRDLVVKSLASFINHYENCKIVLSGRPHGLSGAVLDRFGKRLVKIHTLNMEQIESFIKKWFEFIFTEESQRGKTTAAGMISGIRGHQTIKELLDNPLMLTAICILYYDDRKLPEQRAELYKKFVDNLLYRRFDDPEEVRDFLMTIAFKVHGNRERGFDWSLAMEVMKSVYSHKEGDSETGLERKFKEIEQNCGLLKLERGQYSFWHLTFQEFLGARFVSTKRFDYIKEIEGFWEEDWYREFIELFIGFLSIDSKGWANKIVLDSLNNKDKSPFKRWRLAARSLLDMHKSTWESEAHGKATEQMLSIFKLEEKPEILADAGEILGWLGDPRDMEEFVKIIGGKYELKDLGDATLGPFEIGKYPVTNRWYEKFITEEGYKKPEYWSKEGKQWLEENKSTSPHYWYDRDWNCPNSPVVGVCWYEADAFCRWLTNTRKDGTIYRLPSEHEWQAAAAGKEGREYPWGDEKEESRCNTGESSIKKTTSVGIFKKGNTPEKVADLAGNVWEWTRTGYESARYRYETDNPGDTLRGGSWLDDVEDARCVTRDWGNPSFRINIVGFRCSRTQK